MLSDITVRVFAVLRLPANNDILLQFPYTKLTCVRILPLVNVLVLLGDELLAVILADVNTNLYLPTQRANFSSLATDWYKKCCRKAARKRSKTGLKVATVAQLQLYWRGLKTWFFQILNDCRLKSFKLFLFAGPRFDRVPF